LVVSEQGPIASDGGHVGTSQGEHESGHGTGQDAEHEHAHAPEHLRPRTMYRVIVAASLTVAVISHFLLNGGIKVPFNYITEIWEAQNRAVLVDVAKTWKKQLQTNVKEFPFSQQAAEYIEPFSKLTENPSPEISCFARLGLGTAYFVANLIDKAVSPLKAAESTCTAADANKLEQLFYSNIVEELFYLRGRVETELARHAILPGVRKAYEDAAWEDYHKSWQHGQKERNFAVAAVQICMLSKSRTNMSTSDLRELEKVVREAIMTDTTHPELIPHLTQQQEIVRYKRGEMEVQELINKNQQDIPLSVFLQDQAEKSKATDSGLGKKLE
jgi:hypothetical protein